MLESCCRFDLKRLRFIFLACGGFGQEAVLFVLSGKNFSSLALPPASRFPLVPSQSIHHRILEKETL